MAGERDLRHLLEVILDTGKSPEEVCQGDPELLAEVQARLQYLRLLEAKLDVLLPSSSGPEAGPAALRPWTAQPPHLSGYEVQDELGRGGMGVVYRAWDQSLHRPVALKMLLAGDFARPDERERFAREAEAAAGLRHPNIVQVYHVGELEGRPYFTMEFIEGGSLAEKLAGAPLADGPAAALIATLAEAVQAAHDRGIVHRDLKPGNVLLTADGTPKIADFGLARRLDDRAGLTRSGVPLGTPNYMAPEQALGLTHSIGPAADVYALGAILYEALTGRPPFRADTTAETLRQVVEQEPMPPSRWNAKVPRELEVICLKCLHKEPHRRYPSATALADDLRRFERCEPIMARPLGRLGRLARWARRRPTAAALAVALLAAALLALTLAGGGLWLIGQRQATAQYAEQDLREADRLLQRSDLTGARAALERAKGRLGVSDLLTLRQRVSQAEVALQRRSAQAEQTRALEQRLNTIRLDGCVIAENHLNRRPSDRDYAEVFRSAGLGTSQDDARLVAARINNSPARAALVASLDYWAICTADERRRDWLLTVARLADPDPWRDRVRDPAAWVDRAKLTELTRTAPTEGQSVQLLLALGECLDKAGGNATPFLRQVEQEHPGDFYANLGLGTSLVKKGEAGVAIGFLRMALALQPDSTVANYNLGIALDRQGRKDEALPCFERAVRIDRRFPLGHSALADALKAKGRTDEAISHYHQALRLDPKLFFVHNKLGLALEQQGRPDDAIGQYEEALRIDPRYDLAHYSLSKLLWGRGRRAEAVEHCRAALAANPHFTYAQAQLGMWLTELDRRDEAIHHLRQAVARAPRENRAQEWLRTALIGQGRLKDAKDAWRKALDAGPPEHDAWFGYAELCLFLGDENEYRRARRTLLVRFGRSTDTAVAERTARACLLLPGTKDETEDAVALADRAVAAGRAGRERSYPYYLFAKGLAEYRLGRFDEAITLMSGEAARIMGPCPRLVTALALHQKGLQDQAKKTLAAAVLSYDWSVTKADNHGSWIAHILRRQAEALSQPNIAVPAPRLVVPTG